MFRVKAPPRAEGRSSSLRLALAYTVLTVYASLHPFSGWRDPGELPWAFIAAGWPRYFTTFDVAVNILGYFPLGLFFALGFRRRLGGLGAGALAILLGMVLSLVLEGLQNYLPTRIPSLLDFLSNACGAAAGAVTARVWGWPLLDGAGFRALKSRWLEEGRVADWGLLLVGLWLFAQINPEGLPFGSGDLRAWFPRSWEGFHGPLAFAGVEAGVAAANLFAVGLLIRGFVKADLPAWAGVAMLLLAAPCIKTLAAAILLGPEQAWAWLTPGTRLGMLAGAAALVAGFLLPAAWRAPLALLAVIFATALLNLAPLNPYLAVAQEIHPPGHFLNFNGLTRSVSEAWPFLAVGYLLAMLGRSGRV